MKGMRPLIVVALIAIGAPAFAQDVPAAPAKPKGRVVGVFDVTTGLPVVNAKVEDMFTGWSAQTTATGTVALNFVDTAGTMLRINRLGYAPQTMAVSNTPADTAPVTVVLHPVVMLPEATTTARNFRGPADTVRKLELAGFYERRIASGAPSRAFVTRKELNKLTLFADIKRLTGRNLCKANLYIDGVRVTVPELNLVRRKQSEVYKDGLDALLNPEQVVGIEMYYPGDVPAQWNATSASYCGATLIWTR
jgi:hypothetical protein